MKVGIFQYLSTAYSIDPAVLAQRAEALGFDSLWLPEHPIMPVTTVSPFPLGGPIPDFYSALIDPFVGLARASAVTKTSLMWSGPWSVYSGKNESLLSAIHSSISFRLTSTAP